MPYLKLGYFPPCCRLKFASLLSALSSSSSTPTPLSYLLPIPTLFGCIIPFYNTLVLVGAHLDWSSLFSTFLTPPLSSFHATPIHWLLLDSLPPFASPNPMLQHKLPRSDTANQTLQDRTLPSCPASTKSPPSLIPRVHCLLSPPLNNSL